MKMSNPLEPAQQLRARASKTMYSSADAKQMSRVELTI